MGKIRHIVKEDLKKMLTSTTFWCAIMAFVVISLMGSVARDMENQNHNIFDLLLNYSKSEIMNEMTVSAKSIIYTGSSSYLWMFAPVIAGMPIIPLLCAERKNKAMRYELYRVGKTRFMFGKLFSSMLSGGMVFMFGYAIFMIAVYILMPIKGMSGNTVPEYMDSLVYVHPGFTELYSRYGFILIVAAKLVLFFIYGAVSSAFAYMLSSFIMNKYIVLCVPYIFNYILCMFADRQMMRTGFGELSRTCQRIIIEVKCSNLEGIFLHEWAFIKIFCIIHGSLITLCVIVYAIVMNRRCDCGQ